LPERVRYELADYLGISQDKTIPYHWQREIHGARPVDLQIQAVPCINMQASADASNVIDAVEEHDIEQWYLPKQWLRQLGNGQIDSL
jgi:hypothetical protein